MYQIHYAVDIKTKTHRTLEDHERLKPGERLVIAGADGWIEWHGGKCPLPEEIVAEFTRCGCAGSSYVVKAVAGAQRWSHRGFYSDIIAYRPILNDKEQDMNNSTACNGINCSAQAPDYNHSVECRFEHFMAYSGNGNTEECKAMLDLSCNLRDLLNEAQGAGSEPKEWRGPEPGERARTSGGDCIVLAIDVERGKVAAQWHDGELGVVNVECMKSPTTDREQLHVQPSQRATE